jgi:hypothetical protein
MRSVAGDQSLAEQLGTFYERNGFVRRQNPDRIEAEGWGKYKKGLEVRLTANSEAELEHIRRLLRAAGFKPGRAYRHGGRQLRQPLYGRRQVERFLELIGQSQVAEHARRADRPEA